MAEVRDKSVVPRRPSLSGRAERGGSSASFIPAGLRERLGMLAMLAVVGATSLVQQGCEPVNVPSDRQQNAAGENADKTPKFGTVKFFRIQEGVIKFSIDTEEQTFMVVRLLGLAGEVLQENEMFVGPGSENISIPLEVQPPIGAEVEVLDEDEIGSAFPVETELAGPLPSIPEKP